MDVRSGSVSDPLPMVANRPKADVFLHGFSGWHALGQNDVLALNNILKQFDLGLPMTATDVAAWVGALTGTGVLLWDIFKWVHSGARIKVTVAPNMKTYGSAVQLYGNKHCVVVEAINVGQAKTTITHLAGFQYKSRWDRFLRGKPSETIVVPNPQPGQLPHVLDVGERWLGMMEQNEELANMSREGFLYVGVYHSTARRPVVERLIIHVGSET